MANNKLFIIALIVIIVIGLIAFLYIRNARAGKLIGGQQPSQTQAQRFLNSLNSSFNSSPSYNYNISTIENISQSP